ncbi:MAG: hypothetical protein NTU79_09705 [Planctomycetota bacterium]|nr:hypothetical protein [Planctomycetota bacterium]
MSQEVPRFNVRPTEEPTATGKVAIHDQQAVETATGEPGDTACERRARVPATRRSPAACHTRQAFPEQRLKYFGVPTVLSALRPMGTLLDPSRERAHHVDPPTLNCVHGGAREVFIEP